ncbi:MAG: 1-(5-phosphoribosyl)-5-amino-4-imidazole-carboxylate carboxylase [Candidatus Binatia bacterium]|nr:MAG: 1-(5-phosphoribosyl)-5-amino-4-imidazole-carboxylate carboxylase [Candidatus Binatia bacterium]
MEPRKLKQLLQDVRERNISVDEAVEALKTLPFEDLQFAKVDHHRAVRTGFPEVIYAPGKTVEHIVEIARALVTRGHDVLVTRVEPEAAAALERALPGCQYYPTGRIVALAVTRRRKIARGAIAVVVAGTADLPVAEEAAVTAEFFGNRVHRIYDVGVAGLHRLLAHVQTLRRARVLIVVAGMEGALPSVVAGLVERPVIAVPTSVGYGASFGGLAALLAMLNSCAAGVTVVNIDNGFGAAVAASLINQS